MSYRDEKEALAAKVVDLEARLARSEAEVAALSGTSPDRAAADEVLGPPSSFGTPTSLTLSASIEHPITSAGYEAIAALLERELGLRVQQVGQSLTAPGTAFRLVPAETGLTVTLSWDWRALAPAGWIATVTTALGAPPVALLVGMVAYKTIATLLGDPHPPNPNDTLVVAGLLTGAPLAGAAVNVWARAASRRRIAAESDKLRRVLSSVVELARRHRAPITRARVEVADVLAPDEEASSAASEGQMRR